MKRNELEALVTLIKGGFVSSINQSSAGYGVNRGTTGITIRMDAQVTTDELGALSNAIYNRASNRPVKKPDKAFKIAQRKHEKEVLAKRKHK